MKKRFTLFFLICLTPAIFATVRTVDNNTNAVAQFTNLQTAIDSSMVGDSIYVIGSPTNYGNITITKKLIILGSGYNVQGTPYNFNSIVTNITIDSLNGGSQVSGLTFKGLRITGSINSGSNTSFLKSNITIKRCRLDGYSSVLGNGWVVNGNIINSALTLNNHSNLIISNNIIYGYISTSNDATVLISNNDFIKSSNGGLYSVTNALISNNIFYQIASFSTYDINNTFNKNIGYHATNVITLPPANNTGSGNISNTNPNFKDVPTTASTSYETTYDYTLNAGSPAINAGTDGTNLGVFGGSTPAANTTGATTLPQIEVFDVNNSLVPKDGTLHIHLKARQQN